MNLFHATRSVAARLQCARHCELIATSTLLTLHRNKLFHYNRFYCSNRLQSSSCFHYRKSIDLVRKGFLLPKSENVTCGSSFFWCKKNVLVRGMAGHSKWQNIKHIKGAKDKQKGDLATKFAQRIRIAIKEGGADPKFNNHLERIIAEAKKTNLTNSMIENAIKGASASATVTKIAEVKFLGHCILVVEIATNKLQVTKNEIQTICRKNGGKVENGSSEGVFDKKGIIHVATEKPDLDSALELAIEVGAEDVTVESDEDDTQFLQFTCGDKDLYVVRRLLEAKEHDVTYSEYEYLPTVMYPLDENGLASLEVLINKLYQHSDVVKIFDNAASLEPVE